MREIEDAEGDQPEPERVVKIGTSPHKPDRWRSGISGRSPNLRGCSTPPKEEATPPRSESFLESILAAVGIVVIALCAVAIMRSVL